MATVDIPAPEMTYSLDPPDRPIERHVVFEIDFKPVGPFAVRCYRDIGEKMSDPRATDALQLVQQEVFGVILRLWVDEAVQLGEVETLRLPNIAHWSWSRRESIEADVRIVERLMDKLADSRAQCRAFDHRRRVCGTHEE